MNRLKKDLKKDYEKMIAYSLVRHFWTREVTDDKSGNGKKFSHEKKFPHLPPGQKKELQQKAEQYFRCFVHTTRDAMLVSGIPKQCLLAVHEKKHSRKYEIAYDMCAYIREQVTQKRSAMMTRIVQICQGK